MESSLKIQKKIKNFMNPKYRPLKSRQENNNAPVILL